MTRIQSKLSLDHKKKTNPQCIGHSFLQRKKKFVQIPWTGIERETKQVSKLRIYDFPLSDELPAFIFPCRLCHSIAYQSSATETKK